MDKKHVMDRGLQLSMFREFLKQYFQGGLVSEIEWRAINNGIVASEHGGKAFTKKQIDKLDQLLRKERIQLELTKSKTEREKWLIEVLSLMEYAQTGTKESQNKKTLKLLFALFGSSILIVFLVNLFLLGSKSIVAIVISILLLFVLLSWFIMKNTCPRCGKFFSFSTVKSEETERYITSREEDVLIGQLYIKDQKIGDIKNRQLVNYLNVDFRDVNECIYCGYMKESRTSETRKIE
jgi:hypothetical protein